MVAFACLLTLAGTVPGIDAEVGVAVIVKVAVCHLNDTSAVVRMLNYVQHICGRHTICGLVAKTLQNGFIVFRLTVVWIINVAFNAMLGKVFPAQIILAAANI